MSKFGGKNFPHMDTVSIFRLIPTLVGDTAVDTVSTVQDVFPAPPLGPATQRLVSSSGEHGVCKLSDPTESVRARVWLAHTNSIQTIPKVLRRVLVWMEAVEIGSTALANFGEFFQSLFDFQSLQTRCQLRMGTVIPIAGAEQ